ncbi:MAG: CNNM domain-containing protein [Oscillospiraceae bacterium]|jgi:CBS domain containing-hemolysin-like protein|nr:CNNM domain-containing protein [Oscillospiraceae bacterium]
MTFTFASSEALAGAGYVVAFMILAVFILFGIVFDAVGVAIMSASEKPFHSMAAHKEKGAAEALRLIKNAEKAATICNDVVSDIAGIISGTTAALIAEKIMEGLSLKTAIVQLVISGLVTGATIGGKAAGKTFAIKNSTAIVLRVGKLLSIKKKLFPGKKPDAKNDNRNEK